MMFEDMHKVLSRITRRYVGWRFEHDELINQAWLSPYVRNAQTEHHLVRAGLNAVCDYLRSELGRYKPKLPQHLTSEPLVEDRGRDVWMDFDAMSSGMSRTQKLIIKLRADWFNDTEIGRIIGITSSRVGQLANPVRRDQKVRRCL